VSAPKATFGARLPASGPASSVARLKESTKEAEALGYDAVWIMDHIHNSHERHTQYPVGMGSHRDPSNTLEPNQFETIASLSYLAGMTEKIEFGVGVMAVPLREPIVLAKEIASFDALAGGRFIWGVGVSNVSDKSEYAAMNVPFEQYADRYQFLGETIAAARTIWEQPSATFHGKYVNFDNLVVYPKPARRVPVWIGCMNLSGGVEHPAVRFALDHADGWIYGFLVLPSRLRSMIDDFKATARNHGKDMSNFGWCYQLRLSIGETEKEARNNVDWVLTDQQRMSQYAGYMWNKDESWRDAPGGEDAPQSALSTAVIGTPELVRERVAQLIDAGSTHFDLWFIYPTYEAFVKQLRLFAKEVIPAFR
jgi:alkanesulfonate monooxygenase SsuD/methylene tetrahydromethanopterin reductase-like flavin-dependent oxidoreductase (luciferase family)